jgi:hypothetical protein
MYSACISCKNELGTNEVLEQFPVGRRLAFDPYRGRLWVLCPDCRSWNLAPLEERWEAVEGAERLFERAALGASTENVALGRVREGTELIRVGRVERPEFAAWRYGGQILARRSLLRRELSGAGAQGLALGGVIVATTTAGLLFSPWLIPAGIAALTAVDAVPTIREMRRPVLRFEDRRVLSMYSASKARLVPADTEEGWHLIVPITANEELALSGADALRILRTTLPKINPWGSSEQNLREATDAVERLGHPDRVFCEAARALRNSQHWWSGRGRLGAVNGGPRRIQLTLEMAANEDVERRALQGEVSVLEQEWKEAEELAAISDELLLPHKVRERLREWKRGRDAAGRAGPLKRQDSNDEEGGR